MRKLILISILVMLSVACVTTATLTPAALSAPTRTPPRMLPTQTPNWQATAQRAEAIVTAEILGVERGRLALDGTQAAHEMSMQELNAARQNELDRTRTAAEAFVIISRAQVEASATAAAVSILVQNAGATGTAQAQAIQATQIVLDAARATQTADAPLAYVRQRAQLTEMSDVATERAAVATVGARNSGYYSAAGKWSVGLLILVTFGFLSAGIYALYVLAHNKQITARAGAARQRIINTSGGPTFAGDNGAQAIPQGNRPLVNMSYPENSAGYAESAYTEPAPPRDLMREKVGKLLLESAAIVGWDGDTIPSADELSWSDSERDLAVKWLQSAGAVYTRVGKGTYISLEWENVRNLYQALQSGQLQVRA